MKLLVVNPNSSETVTGAIMESARRGASPGTELIGVTTKGGTRNIDSAFGDYLSGAFAIRTCLESVEMHGPDAVVLAGFGRVGVDALKEALTIPVVSIAESSMAVACLLGHRFTTLTMLRQFIPYQQDLVRYYGFEQIRTIVSEDRAEVVILACAGLCGYDQALSRLAGIPVLDPAVVGVKVAESLVALGLCHSKVRKFAHPPQPLADYL